MDEEFTDIPISDVTVLFSIVTENDRRRGSIGMEYSEPLPLALYSIWASDRGEPVGVAGYGDAAPPGCFQVLVATDQRAMWGRKCPECGGYWRTGTPGFAASVVCCYCGSRFAAHECLSDAQQAYVKATCSFFADIIEHGDDGQYKVRARALLERGIADGATAAPPDFFVEKSKQTKFTCEPCGSLNDILGRFGYCSSCGSRNDMAMLELDISKTRVAINTGGIQLSTALKEAVDGFDTVGRNIARQLCTLVPMTPARFAKWGKANFAQLNETALALRADFDIDVFKGLDASERAFAALMFHRRHLHAHKGGIADQKYLTESGDTSVEVGQLVKESLDGVHRLLASVVRIGRNLIAGFHSIIPVSDEPIQYHRERLAEMNRSGAS